MNGLGLVLIGPPRAGKSTLSRWLGRRIGIPVVSVDAVEATYYAKVGHDPEEALRLKSSDLRAYYAYRRQFEPEILRMILTDVQKTGPAVVDVGAGHVIAGDLHETACIHELQGFSVFAIIPYTEKSKATEVLYQRTGSVLDDDFDIIAELTAHPAWKELSEHTICTGERTVEESGYEILDRLGLDSPVTSVESPHAELDRRSVALSFGCIRSAFAPQTDYLDQLQAFHKRLAKQRIAELGTLWAEPLSAWGLEFANDVLTTVERALSPVADLPSLSSASRKRATRIGRETLGPDDDFATLLSMDPFHGVMPFVDGRALARILDPSPVSGEEVRRLQEVLFHRFLHRPQRTRHLLLHELIVGSWLHELVPGEYEKLAHEAFGLLTQLSHHDQPDLRVLHFAAEGEIELSPDLESVLVGVTALYFYLEYRVHFSLGHSIRDLLCLVLEHCLIPATKRLTKGHSAGLLSEILPPLEILCTGDVLSTGDHTACQLIAIEFSSALVP